MHRFRKLTSPVGMLGVIAVIIALTGTAIAGSALKKNSVGFKAIDYKTTATSVVIPVQATNNGLAEAYADCGNSKKWRVFSGGATVNYTAVDEAVEIAQNGQSGNGWVARFNNDSGSKSYIGTVSVRCIKKQ